MVAVVWSFNGYLRGMISYGFCQWTFNKLFYTEVYTDNYINMVYCMKYKNGK